MRYAPHQSSRAAAARRFQYKFGRGTRPGRGDRVIARDSAVVLVGPGSVPFLADPRWISSTDLIGASAGWSTRMPRRLAAAAPAFRSESILFLMRLRRGTSIPSGQRIRSSADLAEGLFADIGLPAGNQMRRWRRSRGKPSRPSAIMWSPTARRLQRCRAASKLPFDDTRPRLARR